MHMWPNPYLIRLSVPAGGRVIVVSDLHLGAVATTTSQIVTEDLARRLANWTGPGVLVFAGDTFELLDEPNNSPSKALRSHPRLVDAVARFRRASDHATVVLAGEHDRAVAEDEPTTAEVLSLFADNVGATLDLEITTGEGVRRVRVEHGGNGEATDNSAMTRQAGKLFALGYSGYVTGSSHRPELLGFDGSFYANAGCGTDITVRRPVRFGRGPVTQSVRRCSRFELEAGGTLHGALWVAQTPTRRLTLGERARARATQSIPSRSTEVATLSPTVLWSTNEPDAGGSHRSHRRVRTIAASSIAAVGALDLVSALTPPLASRLQSLGDAVPLIVPETATFATAAIGVIGLLLAGGLRRGQRRAWAIALGVLCVSAVANVVKGLDVEEAVLSLMVAAFLTSQSAAFRGRTDQGSSRRAVAVLAVVGFTSVAMAAGVSAASHSAFTHVFVGFIGRLAGGRQVPLPGRIRLIGAAVTAGASVSGVGVIWLLLRPRRPIKPDTAYDARAWALVERHGRGTLDYFALRDDKLRYIHGETVVAYAVLNGVAIVSPDPIGPAPERREAWAAFRLHANDNGWSIAVSGASHAWLPIYREAGMTAIYAGDEAVVSVHDFSLDGGRNKGLRQAVNRVAKAGYRVDFFNPNELSEAMQLEIANLMGLSRKGDVERGFSMTLSRLFDPRDNGLLLAVAFDPAGAVVAFCQYVPAPGIDGYSLDLMRRTDGPQPNGLTDFVVVATIDYLRHRGKRSLGLNFSTMRAVLAGEVDDTWFSRRQRSFLRRLGNDMQIESLWRFNAKYDPTWTPRYIVVEGPDHLVAAGRALASAESLWELPVVGRFLRPSTRPERVTPV